MGSAGVIDAAGLARDEMGEDCLDEFGCLDARDDAQRAATHATVFDVDAEDALEPIHDLPAVVDREEFVRERGAGDVAAQAFEGVPVMGFAHGAGMNGESRELGDARVVGRRAGADGAKRQGLAPGAGAGDDAVVDGGAEELIEIVGGLDVERGGLRSRHAD